MDDVVYGQGPFVRDGVVDLRSHVGDFWRYSFVGVLVEAGIGEEVLRLAAVEVEEVVEGRGVELGRQIPVGSRVRPGQRLVAGG